MRLFSQSQYWTHLLTITAVRDADGDVSHFVELFSDITRRKELEEQLRHNAHYDALTGVTNRMLLAAGSTTPWHAHGAATGNSRWPTSIWMVSRKRTTATASIGLAFFPPQASMDADQFMRQADQAMYRAKLSGKNRFHVFDIETATEPV